MRILDAFDTMWCLNEVLPARTICTSTLSQAFRQSSANILMRYQSQVDYHIRSGS